MSLDVAKLEQNPQTRWKVVERPVALPGECLLCRGAESDREWFVDTGISFDWYGAVYICSACVCEINSILGFLSHEESQDMRDIHQELLEDNFTLRTELASLRPIEELVNGLVESRLRDTLLQRSSPVSTPPDPTPVEPDAGALGESETGSSGGEESVGAGAGASPEPLHDEGVDELYADAEPDGRFELNL